MLTGSTRRSFLLGLVSLLASACARVAPRAAPPPAQATTPELDAWNTEAQAMLSDALQTLRTFDVYAAFRVTTAPGDSGQRPPSSLMWDPPTSAAWDEANHVTRGLHGRADQLFQAITKAQIDPARWREQRALADATHDLQDLGDALQAYRARIDALPPGDASASFKLLDSAWTLWEVIAGRFGVSRGEQIEC